MITELKTFVRNYSTINLTFQKKSLLKEYQNHWINLFTEVVSNPLPEELQWRYNQCFVIPVHISDIATIDIQFDIDYLLEQIDKLNLPLVKLPTTHFILNTQSNRQLLIENSNLIGYATDKSFQSVSDQPIVICQSDFHFNFVLDGNHRVDYAIRHQQKSIQAFVLSSRLAATTPHLFADRISYLAFSFLEDIELLRFALYEKQRKGLFGILKTEVSLLKHQSILPIVRAYIDDTSHQN